MTIDFVTAEAGVRQLHSRYADAVFRSDVDAFGDCFAEDAEWRVEGWTLRGRDEAKAFIRTAFPLFKRMLMTFRSPILHIADGVVSARTYVSENSQHIDGRPTGPMGIYYERFVDEGDCWRFKWRLFQTHYVGPVDFSVPFFDVEDFGPPPNMPPLDAPTFERGGQGPGSVEI